MKKLEELNFHHLFYFWVVANEGSVTAASKRLGLAQPSVSAQVRKLEQSLGGDLFEKGARGRRLSDLGRSIHRHADQVFGAGQSLVDFLNGRPNEAPPPLVVGVPDVMPKLLTMRLLSPAFEQPTAEVICHASRFENLLSDLAVNRFDVVLSHAPVGSHLKIRAFNHKLGESTMSFFACSGVAPKYRDDFPGSLDGAPTLLPIAGTELRRSLDQWFDHHQIRPRIVAQVHDSALLKEFGAAGFGVFAAPSAIAREVCHQYNVEPIGEADTVTESFYALTTQKRIVHPGVAAIVSNARDVVLASGSSTGAARRQSAMTN